MIIAQLLLALFVGFLLGAVATLSYVIFDAGTERRHKQGAYKEMSKLLKEVTKGKGSVRIEKLDAKQSAKLKKEMEDEIKRTSGDD